MAKRPDQPLMRSLGAFFGEIWKGVKADPTKPARHVTRRDVEEHEEQTPQGKVILRRTTVEEIIVPPNPKPHEKL